GFHQLAEGQVVGRDAGLWREGADLGAVGVVFAEAHHDEARHRAVLGKRVVLVEAHVDVVGVAGPHALGLGESVIGGEVADEPGDAGVHLEAALAVRNAFAVLAVAAVREPGPLAGVPQVAAGRVRQPAFIVVVHALAGGVGQVPVAGDVIGVV